MLSQQYAQQKSSTGRGKEVKAEMHPLPRSLSNPKAKEPSDGDHYNADKHDRCMLWRAMHQHNSKLHLLIM